MSEKTADPFDLVNEGQPNEKPEDKQGRLNKRFSDLTSARDRALDALNQSNQKYEETQRRLRDMENRLEAIHSEGARPKGELEAFDDDDLYLQRAKLMIGRDDEDENVRLRKLALVEKEADRRRDKRLQETIQRQTAQVETRAKLRDENGRVIGEALRSLGDDAKHFINPVTGQLDPTSEATQVAVSVYRNLQKTHGEELPSYAQELSILKAAHWMRSRASKDEKGDEFEGGNEANLAEERLRTARTRGQIPAQSGAAGDRGNRTALAREALAKGESKNALANLPIIAQMQKDVESFL